MAEQRPDEHLEIKIIECKNGFVIEKSRWIEGTCASIKETWIANEAKQVSEIIYNELPKG